MTKHTPGPWKVQETNEPGIFNKSFAIHTFEDWDDPYALTSREGRIIARTPTGLRDIDRANAALIAASPELLEIAAAALVNWHAKDSNFHKAEPEYIRLAHKLVIVRQAAIAKAEAVNA